MHKFHTRGEMLVMLALEKKSQRWGNYPAHSYVDEIHTPTRKEIINEDRERENNESDVLNEYVSDILVNYNDVSVPIPVAKRRRKSTPNEWKRNEAIKQRTLSKAYSGKRLIGGIWTTVGRPAREMGEFKHERHMQKLEKETL